MYVVYNPEHSSVSVCLIPTFFISNHYLSFCMSYTKIFRYHTKDVFIVGPWDPEVLTTLNSFIPDTPSGNFRGRKGQFCNFSDMRDDTKCLDRCNIYSY